LEINLKSAPSAQFFFSEEKQKKERKKEEKKERKTKERKKERRKEGKKEQKERKKNKRSLRPPQTFQLEGCFVLQTYKH